MRPLHRAVLGALLAAASHVTTARADIELHGMFEGQTSNPTRYDDPVGDVRLTVRYTRPDGSVFDRDGYFDGDGSWGFRVNPDQAGTWRYESRFSDGAPGGAGTFVAGASTYRTSAAAAAGPVMAYKANPLWFSFGGTTPVLLRSFHVRYPYANPDRLDPLLRWAKKQGYNMLSVNGLLAAKYGTKGVAPLWPIKPENYKKVEDALHKLGSAGFAVWTFYGLFPEGHVPKSEADQEKYIEYAVNRLGPIPYLVWSVSGPEPDLSQHISHEQVSRFGALMRKALPPGRLLGVHNRPGNDRYRDEAWLNMVTLQLQAQDKAKNPDTIRANTIKGKPVFCQECIWAGNSIQGWAKRSVDEWRSAVWTYLLLGTTLNMGDMNGRSGTGFSGSGDLKDLKQERHDAVKPIWDFMETVPFWRMKPCPDAVPKGMFALCEPGKKYVVYLPTGGSVTVKGAEGLKGVWREGKNPANGRPASGNGRFEAPGGGDWVLDLGENSGTTGGGGGGGGNGGGAAVRVGLRFVTSSGSGPLRKVNVAKKGDRSQIRIVADPSLGIKTVEFALNGAVSRDATAPFNVSGKGPRVAPGSYVLKVKASDAAGKVVATRHVRFSVVAG